MSQTRMLQIVTRIFKANGNKSLGLSSPVLFMKKQHCCPFNFMPLFKPGNTGEYPERLAG